MNKLVHTIETGFWRGSWLVFGLTAALILAAGWQDLNLAQQAVMAAIVLGAGAAIALVRRGGGQ